MFEKLKRKIAHFILSRKYLNRNNEAIYFNNILSTSNNFFVILPSEDNDKNNSLDLIKYLLIHKKNVTIFSNQQLFNKFVSNKDKIDFITFSTNNITKLNLPSKDLINKLKIKNFDVVIDLNRKENTFFSAIANVVKSKVRISFQKDLSDPYYNFLFQNKNGDSELAYRNFLEVIRMF